MKSNVSQSCLKMDSTPTFKFSKIKIMTVQSQSCLKMDSTPTKMKKIKIAWLSVAILP